MLKIIEALRSWGTEARGPFGAADLASDKMKDAILGWIREYYRREPDKDSDPCQRLPYTIVHKLEKGMFAEYSSNILDREATAKGAWQAANLAALDGVRGAAVQWMLIAGEAGTRAAGGRRGNFPPAPHPPRPGHCNGPRAGRTDHSHRDN